NLANTVAPNPAVQYVPTTGTILVLNFGEVIHLTEAYYAPGSLGTFNLQLTTQVQTNQNEQWDTNTYELIIMPMNSGVFVNERGTSSTFLFLLTKQDVLGTLQQQPYANYEVRRLVGGGFLDNLRSAMGWIQIKLPGVRGALESIPHPYAHVMKALGYGKGHKSIDNRLE
ncbi:MAG: major capsid protein V20 domain-containing protein, partial [Candidatus Fonsibacter sp.]